MVESFGNKTYKSLIFQKNCSFLVLLKSRKVGRKMKASFFCFCLFFFLSVAFHGTWGRENKTQNRSFFAFINNFFSRRVSRTFIEHDHSVRGLATDWLAAIKYKRGEIGFNATITPLHMSSASAGHSLQRSLPRILNVVSVISFRKYFVLKFFPCMFRK